MTEPVPLDLPAIAAAATKLQSLLTSWRPHWQDWAAARQNEIPPAGKRRVFDLHQATEGAVREAGTHLRGLLRPSEPEFTGGSCNPDLALSTLPVETRLNLNNVWRELTQPLWEYRTIDPGRDHDRWEKLLLDTIKVLAGQQHNDGASDAGLFLEFAPATRKLLLALRGKGRVPILDVHRAVYGRKLFDAAARRALYALARRAGDALPAKGYASLTVLLEGKTLQLMVMPAGRRLQRNDISVTSSNL